MTGKKIGPASLVHAKYPHNGVKHSLVPDSHEVYANWWEHVLPDGRIGAAVWLYEGSDKMRRTIIVREWDNPNSEVYVQGNVRLGAQCSHVTNQLLEKLAAQPKS